MSVKQISILLEHKPGMLYDMTMTLAENDINIRALTVAETGQKALVRLIVDNFMWTAAILKNAGYSAQFSDVVVAKISNVPGGLSRVLEVLYNAGINVEHMYSIISGKFSAGGDAYMALETSDYDRSSELLARAGITLINQGGLSGL